jgi:capsular polysaccharide biosynthesis protein
MKIDKFLQKYFKKIFQFLFILFYGKIKENDALVIRDLDKKKITDINLKDNIRYRVNKYIYEIPDARVYTDTVQHVAIIKDNTILPNISYQQIKNELKESKFNKVLSSGTPRLIKHIDGRMLSLVQGASGNNYFHFLFDIIAKLKLCEEKINLNNIDFFYVPGNFDWQKKIFSLFGIDEKKLINSEVYRHLKAKSLIAIEHPWYKKGYVQEEIYNLPEWIIFFLREKFLGYAKKFKCSDKIFIDRAESPFNHCKLINNDQIIECLTRKGFESYQVGKLDFFEQIYLFNNAKIIIGPHGAAFTNIIFSNPNTNIIEIIPDFHKSKKCEKITKTLNLNYTKVVRPTINSSNKKLGDMEISIDEINNILDKVKL